MTPGLHLLYLQLLSRQRRLGSADDCALDALVGAGEPLAADAMEVVLVPSKTLDLISALGQVLVAAQPRLVAIATAGTNATTETSQRLASLYPWDTDIHAATALVAYICCLDTAGSIELSGSANGWSLS